jgi:serine protease
VADNMTTEFKGCLADPNVPEPSSWHGTRVSGMLGALTDNAVGVAGLTWGPKILPVRVLGKCGGFDSDIIAGMRWAAGLAVPGVPLNPTPARVLNLSLGGQSDCSAAYMTAITDITGQGASIFASAGNEGGPIDEPANCPGVVGVTAVRHVGTKVGFANVSGFQTTGGVRADVSLAAPGGNCYNLTGACLFSLDTTTNAGTTTPDTSATGYTYTNQTNFNVGTSFSSPIAAGIAALMYSVNSSLTPALLLARLKSGAGPFPNIATDSTGAAIPMCHVAASPTDLQTIECNCTTTTCGAGLANAPGAVAEALRPIAVISVSGTNANGQTVNFSVTGSAAADGRSLTSYAWAITAFSSVASPTLGAATGTTSSLVIPACGSVTVQLTVTDDQGRTDAVSQVFGQAPAAGTCLGPAPTAVISVSGTNANGQSVTLGATGSSAASGHALTAYAWAVTAFSSVASPTLSATTGSTSSLAIPSCGSVTVQLTVTDDQGQTATTSQVLGTAPAAGMTCAAPSGSGGGGGVLDPAALAAAALGAALAVGARRRRERTRH